jgi:hypothetical protein
MLEDFATSHLQQAMNGLLENVPEWILPSRQKSAFENLSLQICDQGLQAEPPIGRLNHGKSQVKHIKLSPQSHPKEWRNE